MECLAKCYGNNLSQYEPAIQWMEEAIQNLPQSLSNHGHKLSMGTNMANWRLHLGDAQESVGIAKAAYEASRTLTFSLWTRGGTSTLRCIKHYIKALYRAEEYDAITKLLYELDQRDTYSPGRSLWVEVLWAQWKPFYNFRLFDKVGHIYRITRDEGLLYFMKASIRRAVALTTDTLVEVQPLWVATEAGMWLYHYASRAQDSSEIWEKMVTLIDQSDEVVQQSQSSYRNTAAGFLSMICFDAAKTALAEGKNPATHISKLEKLAKYKQGYK